MPNPINSGWEVKPFSRISMNCKLIPTNGVFYGDTLIHTYDDLEQANELVKLFEKENIKSYGELCEYVSKMESELEKSTQNGK